MERLVPTIVWTRSGADPARGRALEERIVPLLDAIARRGSLLAAAREIGIPYRSAWALLEDVRGIVGAPLVASTRGRGAVLTPLGERLLQCDARAKAVLKSRARALELPLSAEPREHRISLRVAASHDLALAQLRDRWRVQHDVALEFHGSEESLAAFAGGRADLAGFHVPDRAANDPLLAHLVPSRDVRIRFLRREQGLMLPPGNPDRVRGLRDLAAKGIPFVNRQPGSGTRLLFDRLLGSARVPPDRIVGYSQEEFTHAAIAATIAAGNARAGFGVRAAAAQSGLAFVPLARERYFFACRKRALDGEPVRRFRELLSSAATRGVVRPLPGYALDRPGEVEALPAR